MKLAEHLATVCAVLVGVENPGTAFGHTWDGQCIAFTGNREDMIELFRRLRANLKGEGPTVTVSPEDWSEVREIDRADCPNHMLPAIKGEISYYVPY